jgi:3-hydroxybutyryl-CoA dehydratase
MLGKSIAELKVGDFAEFAKTISETDVYMFAGIVGDFNPAHVNEEYAKGTFFKTRIAHGMLAAGFVSTVIGMQLPGPGTVYLSQDLKFLAPVHIGDTVTARVEVAEIDKEKNRVRLSTSCLNQEGMKILVGNAMVSPPKKAAKQSLTRPRAKVMSHQMKNG